MRLSTGSQRYQGPNTWNLCGKKVVVRGSLCVYAKPLHLYLFATQGL